LLAGVTTSALWKLTQVTPQAGVVRLMIVDPENQHVVGAPIISPDGRRVAFVATTPEGTSKLWLRPIDAMAPQPLQGTEDATYPFWSPDSRFIAFFASGQLKKIDVAGGSPQTICEATNGRGGAWSKAGVIIFSQRISSALVQVSSAGGSPTPLTTLDPSKGEQSHRFPHFLPDGRHFLFSRSRNPKCRRTSVTSTASNRPRDLGRQRGVVRRGYLVFGRKNTLFAQLRPGAGAAGGGNPRQSPSRSAWGRTRGDSRTRCRRRAC
jgi:Tol biopolymer transport system component